jgi:hypothetical protein
MRETVCGTSNPCMQNTGTPKKLPDTTCYDQRRDFPPPKKNELVAKYLKTFSQFIKSIHFSKM